MANNVRPLKPASNTDPELIDAINRMAEAVEAIKQPLDDIVAPISDISTILKSASAFICKWGGWLVGAAALFYPKLAEFIQSLPIG